jgi:integrase
LQQTLSGVTIIKIHTLFKAALKKAMLWKWISENPIDYVKAPSKATKPRMSSRRSDRRDTLTPDEITKFIDSCPQFQTQCLWLFFAYSGARASEVLAAKWSDIDFDKNVFHLRQKIVQTKKVNKFDKLKTDKSERDIPFPEDFIKALKKLKIEQNILRLKSEYWEDVDLIFTTKYGTPLRITNLGSQCYRILDKAEIKKHVTPHMFRHSFATNALKNGVNVKVISDFLGHSSVKITLDIYSHVDLDDKRDVSELMGSLIKIPGVKKASK